MAFLSVNIVNLPLPPGEVQRGCQVLQAGPAECWTDPTAPLTADSIGSSAMFAPKLDAPVRGLKLLSDADLRNVLSQEWGRRLLTIVSHRNWHHPKKETEACQYLSCRCCLCDQYVGRSQDLHSHIKTVHPDYWQHVDSKATQLTNLYADESPCPHCHSVFSRHHSCNVWCQLSMLLLHGGGLSDDPAAPQPARALQCEICSDVFDTSAALHAHLVSEHRLSTPCFNLARDALDGQPACSHCGTTYDALESLRSHINQNSCVYFNPALPTEVVAVRDEWRLATCAGQLADVVRDAHIRLQLTLRCQNCKCVYTRAADLIGHLQAAHWRLWSEAQELIAILVSLIYPEVGCSCNPGTAELATMFSLRLTRDPRFQLETTITTQNLKALWTDPALLTLLRSTCILCAATMHPAQLVNHLHEVHQCGLDLVRFLQQQVLQQMLALNESDHTCYACLQVFNLPAPRDVDPSDQTRAALVRVHYLAQCPNLLQASIILCKCANGRYGHARARAGGQSTSLGCVPAIAAAPGRISEAGAECSGQTTKKRRTSQSSSALTRQRGPAAKSRSACPGPDPDQVDPTTGQRVLLKATEVWMAQQAQPSTTLISMPLRQHLIQALFNELLTRINALGEMKEGSELHQKLLKNQVLLPDNTCPFMEWDHQTKALRGSQRKPLSLKKLHQLCVDILEHLREPRTVIKFHSLPRAADQAIAPWKLQISLRMDPVWMILQELSYSAIWLMLGTSLKPHGRPQNSLALSLQQAMGLQQKKPKGRGKGHTKIHKPPKEES
eukprot:s344_g6.t1